MNTSIARVPGIAWVMTLVVILLVAAGAGIYHAGAARGRAGQQLAQHDAVRTSAAVAVHAAKVEQHAADVDAAVSIRRRDSLARVASQLQARQLTVRQALDARRATVALRGDTALLGGNLPPVVLPVAIVETLRLQDQVNAGADSVTRARTLADSASLDAQHDVAKQLATRDATIAQQGVQLAADSVVIDDLRQEKRPRFGFKSGVAVGAAGVVTTVAILAKVLSLLR